MPIAAALIGLLVGSGLLIYGLYQRGKLRASQTWPQAAATITHSKMEATTSTDQYGTSTSYSATVHYDYFVNGVPYTGKRIGFIRHSYIKSQRAQAEADRFPVGSTPPVYFDPEKPSDAVLVREAPSSFIYIGGGCVLLAIVVAGVLRSLY